MIFGYFTLFVALIISAVAAYYSIVGLTAIFAAAVIPIIIMGAALEVGKVTAAVWLKLNWHRARWTYKLYLIPAVAFLMLLTSMGIFGFLSKAHSDQSLVSGDVQSKIAVYDEKIKTEKENIEANRKALKQMDEGVDQVLGRSTDEKGADKAVALRRSQQKERTRLQNEISQSQKSIAELNDARAPIAAEVRKVEAEVGPIKYVAALIYGDNAEANLLEAAVRWVIILIVAVFDPLALVLILAAQQSLRWAKEDKIVTDVQNYEPDDGPLTDNQLEQIKDSVQPVVTDQPKEEPVIETPKPLPKYLTEPFAHFKNLKPMVYKPDPVEEVKPKVEKKKTRKSKQEKKSEPTVNETPKDIPKQEIITENVTIEAKVKELPYKELDGGYVNFEGKLTSIEALKGMRPDLFLYKTKPVNSSFGSSFPKVASKGDIFVRVDVLPNKIFKFDGTRWIEINKETSDSYLHDQAYTDYIVKEIEEGRYDIDLLTEIEKDHIQSYLTKKD